MNLPAQVQEAEKQADTMLAGGQDSSKEVEELTKKLADAEHKFSVLQGKYDAEVKAIKGDVNLVNRLKNENKTLRKQVEDLNKASIANAEALTELRKQLEKPKKDPEPVLTESDLDVLNDEGVTPKALELIKKLIPSSESNSMVEEKLREISKKIENVQQDFTQKYQSTWERDLHAAIPDIDQYIGESADPAFGKWLDETLRRESLQTALNQQDIKKLKEGIELFKKETAAEPAKPKEEPSKLEKHIEPDETVDFDPANIKPDKVWNMAEVNKFYLDQTKGLWAGREKEAAQIDREIVQALSQGRIKE